MQTSEREKLTLQLSGEATVRTIREIHKLILDGFVRSGELTLDPSALTDVDVTVVQTIISARKSAARDGKRLALSEPARGLLKETLERGGFLARSEEREFWLREEGE